MARLCVVVLYYCFPSVRLTHYEERQRVADIVSLPVGGRAAVVAGLLLVNALQDQAVAGDDRAAATEHLTTLEHGTTIVDSRHSDRQPQTQTDTDKCRQTQTAADRHR